MEKRIETPTNVSRDSELDLYRGWVMLYIVGFIHAASVVVIDWHRDIWATFMLIEMPIIFYIAGAAYTLSSKKSYGKYAVGRIKRIAIPLFIYLIFTCINQVLSQEISFIEIPEKHIEYWWKLIAWKPTGIAHLWFIRPYFVIALLMPVMYHVSNRIAPYGIYLLLIAIMAALYFHPNYVLCYIVPTFAGLYYHRTRPYNIYIILLIMICGVILCRMTGYSWDMQYHKFPSDLMFLSYTSIAIILLNRPLRWCCKHLARIPVVKYIVAQYARYDFTIYLYHIHMIAAVKYACQIAGNHLPMLSHNAIAYPIIAIITIVAMLPTAYCLEIINRTTTQLFSHTYHRLQKVVMGKHE